MNRREAARERLRLRHRIGVYFGYFGLFMGVMSFMATSGEGTPLPPGESAWVVFGWMLGTYLLGWVLGPLVARIYGTSRR